MAGVRRYPQPNPTLARFHPELPCACRKPRRTSSCGRPEKGTGPVSISPPSPLGPLLWSTTLFIEKPALFAGFFVSCSAQAEFIGKSGGLGGSGVMRNSARSRAELSRAPHQRTGGSAGNSVNRVETSSNRGAGDSCVRRERALHASAFRHIAKGWRFAGRRLKSGASIPSGVSPQCCCRSTACAKPSGAAWP